MAGVFLLENDSGSMSPESESTSSTTAPSLRPNDCRDTLQHDDTITKQILDLSKGKWMYLCQSKSTSSTTAPSFAPSDIIWLWWPNFVMCENAGMHVCLQWCTCVSVMVCLCKYNSISLWVQWYVSKAQYYASMSTKVCKCECNCMPV